MQFLVNGIIDGANIGLIALGFSIIYNTTKVFHFAHGAIYTFTAYICYASYMFLKIPLFPSIILALLLATILGMAIENVIYFPLYKKNASLTIAILSSLGVYIIIVNFLAIIFGTETKVLTQKVEKTYEIGNVILTRIQILELFIFIFISMVTVYLLKYTSHGRALRALADNPKLSAVLGLNIKKLRLISFGYGSLLCSVASILIALDVGFDLQIGLAAILTGAVAVILAGVGMFETAISGALIIGVVQNLAVWKISSKWESAITFLILLFILIFRPQGIFGKKRRLEEM